MFKLLTESEKMLKSQKKAKKSLFKKWVYCCDPQKDILEQKNKLVEKLNLLKNKNNQLKLYVETEIGLKINYINANFYSVYKAVNNSFDPFVSRASTYWVLWNYDNDAYFFKKI